MSLEYDRLKNEIDRFILLIERYENALIGLPSALDGIFKIVKANEDEDSLEQSDYKLEFRDRDEIESIIKTLKSNAILMLYNLVEATVRTTMFAYYTILNK
ncbi:hypothetical protein BN1356_01751 [Streptococcus varani]|uniref:MAE-28990/MAE-18760-like HEPN domain-containing protein n=1 Tax=Streptococcus varani TaxID=1608583 RepID=A0A0E3WFF3_9STRE|nr:hypothetical protein [Streptococcus varani]CQR25411.1 hypothetical protein BN1356_01751 [Streptococcus varani]